MPTTPESSARLKKESDQLPYPVWAIKVGYPGPKFIFLWLNIAYEKIVGIPSSAIEGRTPNEAAMAGLMDIKTAQDIARHYNDCVEEMATINYQERICLAGRTDTWKTKLSPRIVDGQVAFIVGKSQLITADVLLENQLRTALAQDELTLHYQPIKRLFDKKTCSYEALIRWGNMDPEQFMRVAARGDLMGQINNFVISEAAKTAALLAEMGVQIGVSINFSEFGIAEQIRAEISRHDLEIGALSAEILEHAVITDEVLTELKGIHDMGVMIAIDDYGTLNSGPDRLVRFQRFGIPVSTLKIDRQFVDGVSRSPVQQAICRACIGIGDELGIAVVAEGIEHTDDWRWLQFEGCEFGQGWHRLLGRAVPREQLPELLDLGSAQSA